MTPQLSADKVSRLKAGLDNFKARSKKDNATNCRSPKPSLNVPKPSGKAVACACSGGRFNRSLYVSDLREPSSSTDHQEVTQAISKTQTHTLVHFGIPTPVNTPKRRNKVTTVHSPTMLSPGFTSGRSLTQSSAPIIHSGGKEGGKRRGKRQRSLSLDDGIEIVRITKRKQKGESVREGSSDSDIICVGHTLDLTI